MPDFQRLAKLIVKHALEITDTELKAIAAPAIIGLTSKPMGKECRLRSKHRLR
jgi:hypothetical protein